MNLLKNSTDFLTRLGEPFAAKTEAQSRNRAVVSIIILIVDIVALYWLLYG